VRDSFCLLTYNPDFDCRVKPGAGDAFTSRAEGYAAELDDRFTSPLPIGIVGNALRGVPATAEGHGERSLQLSWRGICETVIEYVMTAFVNPVPARRDRPLAKSILPWRLGV